MPSAIMQPPSAAVDWRLSTCIPGTCSSTPARPIHRRAHDDFYRHNMTLTSSFVPCLLHFIRLQFLSHTHRDRHRDTCRPQWSSHRYTRVRVSRTPQPETGIKKYPLFNVLPKHQSSSEPYHYTNTLSRFEPSYCLSLTNGLLRAK